MMKTIFLATTAVLSLIAIGCSDIPLEVGNTDMRNTLFPLVAGSVWTYADQDGNVIQEFDRLSITNMIDGFIPPSGLDRRERRDYYAGTDDYLDDDVTGTTDVWFRKVSDTTTPTGYVANDTAIFMAWILGGEEESEGVVVTQPQDYLPLHPVIGHRYQGVRSSIYKGIGMVETPAYSGSAHLFEAEADGSPTVDRMWFAKGVGFVKFERIGSSSPKKNYVVELAWYRIGE